MAPRCGYILFWRRRELDVQRRREPTRREHVTSPREKGTMVFSKEPTFIHLLQGPTASVVMTFADSRFTKTAPISYPRGLTPNKGCSVKSSGVVSRSHPGGQNSYPLPGPPPSPLFHNPSPKTTRSPIPLVPIKPSC